MEARKSIEERIWAYMDATVSNTEKLAVEKLLASDPQWRMIYEELRSLDARLKQSIELESPSLRFSKNVMDRISALQIAPPTRNYVNKKIVYGIGIFFLVLFVVTLASIIPGLDLTSSPSIGNQRIPRMNFNWSALVKGPVFQAFLIIDAVLGLYLLDRYLLSKKAKPGKQQADLG